FFELQERNPDKKFYSVGHRQFCPNMKKVTLDKVEQALESMTSTVELPDDIIANARKPLQRMLELS
ncbi:MAG: quinolinate synthase NadA, partial [Lachnospiraceae bacterium]|nr:quinolinate synthase NadA [Lachnospiraceae bacterium]